MIVSWSDGVMSINGICIALVLSLGEWPWSLHICALYTFNSGQLSLFDIPFTNKKSIFHALVDTIAVSASIFKDINSLVSCMYWHLGLYRTVLTFSVDIGFVISFLLTLLLLLYKHK